jgi:hypothetical protein
MILYFNIIKNYQQIFYFCQTRKIDLILLDFTEFDRFRVFNLISHVIYMLTRKIVRF